MHADGPVPAVRRVRRPRQSGDEGAVRQGLCGLPMALGTGGIPVPRFVSWHPHACVWHPDACVCVECCRASTAATAGGGTVSSAFISVDLRFHPPPHAPAPANAPHSQPSSSVPPRTGGLDRPRCMRRMPLPRGEPSCRDGRAKKRGRAAGWLARPRWPRIARHRGGNRTRRTGSEDHSREGTFPNG